MNSEAEILSILAMSDYWNSTDFTGGVTPLNRALCGALAANNGVTVQCRVGESGPIKDRAVKVITASPLPGVDAKVQPLRLDGLPRKADVVIGHSIHSGGAAQYVQQQKYPNAMRAHFLHTSPDEYARYRGNPESADHRASLERTLIAGSDLVVGIGPVLSQEAARLARSAPTTSGRQPVIHEMIPGMPTDGIVRPLRVPRQTRFHIFYLGVCKTM